MANARNILAGIGAGGPAGLSLAFFAPAGTAGPVAVSPETEATVIIPIIYQDAGWCDQKGLAIKTNVSSNDVKGFGTTQVLRTIISDQKKTIDLDFLETNPISVAVYNSQALDSVVVDTTDGSFSVATGLPKVTQYAAIFDTTDGANHMRYYAPFAQNITPGDLNVAAGQPIDRPISLTLYPDSLGNVLYEYYLVDALKV